MLAIIVVVIIIMFLPFINFAESLQFMGPSYFICELGHGNTL